MERVVAATSPPPSRAFAGEPARQRPRRLHVQRCACGGVADQGGECAGCRSERPRLQRSASGAPTTAPPAVHEMLGSPGKPLDAATRAGMEVRFGHDFGRVRVHDDAKAAASARAVNAAAYTVCQDVVFGAGRYAPGTSAGRGLLAHELAHTIQQEGANRTAGGDLTLGSPGSAAEKEAGMAAARALAGERVSVRPAAGDPGGRLLQRAEQGTYVSELGEKPFLDAAANFYKNWGYPNVRRVRTMDEILEDLNKAKKIEKFRIVSHAHPDGSLDLGFLQEISPEQFDTKTAEFTSEEPFRKKLLSDLRIIDDPAFENLLKRLREDPETLPHLTAIGAESGTPAPESPLGIMLRAILENSYLTAVRSPEGKVPKIANLRVLTEYNKSRLSTYQNVLVSALPGKKEREAYKKASAELIRLVPEVIERSGWTWDPLTDEAAVSLADPFSETVTVKGRETRRLEGRISKAIKEGSGEGSYLRRLRKVREKVTTGTHIEIRGCNIGSNVAALDKFRNYFGPPERLPSISAPDLYQYFFQLSIVDAYGTRPDEEAKIDAAWNETSTGVAQSFDDWYRIRNREMIRVANDETLADVSRRYGEDEGRLRKLNPQIGDPNKLKPGEVVWLKAQPPIPAGSSTSLAEFCERHLRDGALASTIRRYNPEIKDPDALKPTDKVWVVPVDLRTPTASAPRTLDDFRSTLRAGQAFVSFDPTQNKPRAQMDYTQRAKAISGWLANQRFDPKGRTAKELSKLYAGKPAAFAMAMDKTYIEFLSRDYPSVEDPIFPDDPRYPAHIIKRP